MPGKTSLVTNTVAIRINKPIHSPLFLHTFSLLDAVILTITIPVGEIFKLFVVFLKDKAIAIATQVAARVNFTGNVINPVLVSINYILTPAIAIGICKLAVQIIHPISIGIPVKIVYPILIPILKAEIMAISFLIDVINPVTVGILKPIIDSILVLIHETTPHFPVLFISLG
jgi:hypothetical protein